MKINPNNCATGYGFSRPDGGMVYNPGLTIREELAARNMAAILSHPYGAEMSDGTKSFHPEDVAKVAILYADALINELNKEQK